MQQWTARIALEAEASVRVDTYVPRAKESIERGFSSKIARSNGLSLSGKKERTFGLAAKTKAIDSDREVWFAKRRRTGSFFNRSASSL
jgi:hypothetical protein